MDSMERIEATKVRHVPWKMALIIAHAPFLALTLTLNYLSTPGISNTTGLYLSNTGAISDKYPTGITPAGWTFTIWAFIYTWQIIHVIYSLSLICRKIAGGSYLYVYPAHIHFSFYIVYMINNTINIGWIFLFDREYLEAAFAFLFFIALTIYICGVLICRYLDRAGQTLELSGNVKDIWMTRLFTLNGLAMYGTWATIATLVNLSVVLQHRAGLSMMTSAWISLGILTAELLAWFVLETFVFDRHLRYCFSPYIVLLVALSGVLSKQYSITSPASYQIYTVVLLVLSAALGLVKIIVMLVRGRKTPIQYSSSGEITKNSDTL